MSNSTTEREAFELKCPECGGDVSMVGSYDNTEFSGYECLTDDLHDTSGLVAKKARS